MLLINFIILFEWKGRILFVWARGRLFIVNSMKICKSKNQDQLKVATNVIVSFFHFLLFYSLFPHCKFKLSKYSIQMTMMIDLTRIWDMSGFVYVTPLSWLSTPCQVSYRGSISYKKYLETTAIKEGAIMFSVVFN